MTPQTIELHHLQNPKQGILMDRHIAVLDIFYIMAQYYKLTNIKLIQCKKLIQNPHLW